MHTLQSGIEGGANSRGGGGGWKSLKLTNRGAAINGGGEGLVKCRDF